MHQDQLISAACLLTALHAAFAPVGHTRDPSSTQTTVTKFGFFGSIAPFCRAFFRDFHGINLAFIVIIMVGKCWLLRTVYGKGGLCLKTDNRRTALQKSSIRCRKDHSTPKLLLSATHCVSSILT